MKLLQAQLVSIAVVAVLAPASPAATQPVVPPGNSAVNQYTETFPTSRGAAKTKRGKRGYRSPAKVLGSRNARRLESQGPQGRELATVVAATAPTVARSNGNGASDQDGSASRAQGDDDSSALEEVIAQATGSSDSGGMGIALPLLILVAFVGFALYLWRRRFAT